jgi:CBS domain-containing protein
LTWIKAAGRAAFDCEAAMKVSEVMTPSVSVASPDETVERAAATMSNANVGILPVTKGTRLVGIVTDRDLRNAMPSAAEQTAADMRRMPASGVDPN